jgi:hypothetical protein
MLDPLFKTIKDTVPEFTERMFDMDSVFEFELLVRSPVTPVPKDPEATCSVVKDDSTVTVMNFSLTPTESRVSGVISMSSFLCRIVCVTPTQRCRCYERRKTKVWGNWSLWSDSGLTFEEWDPSPDTDVSQPPVTMIVNSSDLCDTGFDLREVNQVIPLQLQSVSRGGRCTLGATLK